MILSTFFPQCKTHMNFRKKAKKSCKSRNWNFRGFQWKHYKHYEYSNLDYDWTSRSDLWSSCRKKGSVSLSRHWNIPSVINWFYFFRSSTDSGGAVVTEHNCDSFKITPENSNVTLENEVSKEPLSCEFLKGKWINICFILF